MSIKRLPVTTVYLLPNNQSYWRAGRCKKKKKKRFPANCGVLLGACSSGYYAISVISGKNAASKLHANVSPLGSMLKKIHASPLKQQRGRWQGSIILFWISPWCRTTRPARLQLPRRSRAGSVRSHKGETTDVAYWMMTPSENSKMLDLQCLTEGSQAVPEVWTYTHGAGSSPSSNWDDTTAAFTILQHSTNIIYKHKHN